MSEEKGKPINARYTLTVSGDCDGPISSAGGVITGAVGKYGLGTKYSYYNIKGKVRASWYLLGASDCTSQCFSACAPTCACGLCRVLHRLNCASLQLRLLDLCLLLLT